MSVVGLGYIGLPTAAMFASKNKKVIGVDVSQNVVNTINMGNIHIVEPGLESLVNSAVTGGYLSATTEPQPADAFLIAVPTPFKEDGGVIPEPDLSFVESAIKAIAPVIEKNNLIILESTSPVGSTEKLAGWLKQVRPDLNVSLGQNELSDVHIAYCPERVLPGKVIEELVLNDRVIGGINTVSSEKAQELYSIFVTGECIVTDARTAEMTKLTENACRDVQIAFANELSMICDKLEINVWELISLANRHPRINILNPGAGVGGHCIAVDPWFIVSSCSSEANLIHTSRKVNDKKPQWVVEQTKRAVQSFLIKNPGRKAEDLKIACYGLSFKPNIDDLRSSPALDITRSIANFHNGKVIAIEPHIDSLPPSLENSGIELRSAGEVAEDISVILVSHQCFNDIQFANIKVDAVGVMQ